MRALVIVGLAALAAAGCGGRSQPPDPWFGAPVPSGVEDPEPLATIQNEGFAPKPAVVPAGEERHTELEGEEIRRSLEAIVGFSRESHAQGQRFWGRVPGFPSLTKTVEWTVQQFREAGLTDVQVQTFRAKGSLWWPRSWELRVLADAAFGAGSQDVVLASAFPTRDANVAGGTLTAPLVYVGPPPTAERPPAVDVQGRIAVQHVKPEGAVLSERRRIAAGSEVLMSRGAVGIINIVEQAGNMHVRDYSDCPNPCFNVGGADGLFLKTILERAAAEPGRPEPRLRLTMEGETLTNPGAENAVGIVPGRSREVVLVNAHADGHFDAAGDNADGLAVLVALARHFGRPENRPARTLVFVASAGHHGFGLPAPGLNGPSNFVRMNPAITGRTVLILNLEHVAQLQVDTDPWAVLPEEQVMNFGVSNSAPFLVDLVKRGVERYGFNLNPTVGTGIGGDLGGYAPVGVPRAQAIRVGPVYHTSADRLEMVSVPGLERAARFWAFYIGEAAKGSRAQIDPRPAL